MNDPTNHLLMKLFDLYQWGDPDEGFYQSGISSSEIEEMHRSGILDNLYHTRPVINYSEEECHYVPDGADEKLQDNLFDLLGVYQILTFKKEGTIFLYESCIKRVGLRFFAQIGSTLRMSRSYCIDMVREIVLWHELGHWITHWMPGKDRNRWNTKSYDYNKESKDVYEGLAQIFVQFAIQQIDEDKTRNDYQRMFHYLLQNQEACYYRYNDIMRHPKFSWNKLLGAITMLRILNNPDDVTFEYLLNNLIEI